MYTCLISKHGLNRSWRSLCKSVGVGYIPILSIRRLVPEKHTFAYCSSPYKLKKDLLLILTKVTEVTRTAITKTFACVMLVYDCVYLKVQVHMSLKLGICVCVCVYMCVYVRVCVRALMTAFI